MNKSWLIAFVILLFGCDHPESRKFERDNEIKSSPSLIEQQPIKVEVEEFRNVLEMETEHGVRYVWIEVNGIKLRFIFDTGASNICLSPAEVTVLYRQGTLQKEDILTTEYFQDATGRISEGTKINLRIIKVGNVELKNVEATVIDNVNAPLLLGQSVLERFGSIEIDNNNNQIILK
jgi:aspartyl protease family protein